MEPASSDFTSYVLAGAESSHGGQYRCGHYGIALADCRRRIDLEFCLATAPERRRSLAKIDLLIEVLGGFRDALAAEARLIEEREHERRGRAAKKRRAKKD